MTQFYTDEVKKMRALAKKLKTGLVKKTKTEIFSSRKGAGTVELLFGMLIFSATTILLFGLFEILNSKKKAIIASITAKVLSEREIDDSTILSILNDVENSLPRTEPKEEGENVISYKNERDHILGKMEGKSLFRFVTSSLGSFLGTFSESGTWVIIDIKAESKLRKWQ